jgi:hypothetical protein
MLCTNIDDSIQMPKTLFFENTGVHIIYTWDKDTILFTI